ncbi:unnamed protein product [Notodromas monacha]|uniref:Equilibrative nucleoside transporter 1 n=1 Tax=Notodromas monacha TaxID=399045 RepID=A0A7R9BQ72_9CRUS|nr:unnamed protein product [Notodromas monacha]CAG0918133.1 unnamed protein product [Notodromas monacha]
MAALVAVVVVEKGYTIEFGQISCNSIILLEWIVPAETWIRGAFVDEEEQPFLGSNDVAEIRLTPAWESRNLPPEQLNFQDVSPPDESEYGKEPPDRMNLVYLTMVLHGVGTLMSWNMFITATDYFTDYKMSEEYTGQKSEYRSNFLSYVGQASQFPNLIFAWVNAFIHVGGDFTRRIVISLSVCVVVFVLTVALAMVDSSGWPGVFFWLTMITVVFLNMANGIYQTTVYGIAAKLPPKYSGAVVLGSNVSGTFTAIISIVSKAMSPNLRTAAIYYFITALFVLLACFDTYFALPLSRFYRYHTRLHDMPRKRNSNKIAGPFGEDAGTEVVRSSLPKTKAQIYWHVFKRCFPQCFNVFLTLFVSLAVFPAVQANIKMSDPSFIIPEAYYTLVLCFLTFNLFATFGNLLPNLIVWPGPRWLWVPVVLRLAFIPAFLLCRYQPVDVERITPIYIENDWIYWAIGAGLGLTSGYYSSLAMMFGPASVEEEYASIAGMFCAASLVTGVFAGVNFSLFSWWFVQNVTWVL